MVFVAADDARHDRRRDAGVHGAAVDFLKAVAVGCVNVALQYRATPAAAGKYWDSLGRA
ncbi:hypothetical protein PCAR4_370032 [Paraburkholderia caribensis]|nr:hypothetical protein PCAR4_370032 [Paraburkholderia caribensis]